MSARVTIHDGILPWICSIADPVRVRANASTLEKWAQGLSPTLAQVDQMSRRLDVPFGWFFLSQPAQTIASPPPAFRTMGSKLKTDMSANLRKTVDRMIVIQEWLKNELEDTADTSPLAGILSRDDSILKASALMRSVLNLDRTWYRSVDKPATYSFLRKKAGDVQVFVFESGIVGNNTGRKLNLDEFRAFALYDVYAPLVFINSVDSVPAKSFSLLHELVHIALGESDIMEPGQDEESFCNSVAAEIMVPEDEFRTYWASRHETPSERIEKAAGFFRCSSSVSALRAFRLGLVSHGLCAEKLSLAGSLAKRKSSGHGDFYRTMSARLDHNFLAMLHASLLRGDTRYTDAYRMTDCTQKSFDHLMDAAL